VVVLVDDAAEEAFAADVDAVGGRGDGRPTGPGQRRLLLERLVRPMLVVVGGVGVQHGPQMAWPSDQDPVGAFAPHGSHPAFGVGVCPRRLRRGLQYLDAGRGEDGVERGGELGVAVADQEPEVLRPLADVREQVPRLLGDPGPGGMGRDAEDVHTAGGDLEHEEPVQPLQKHRVDGEEVAGQDLGGLGS